MKTTSAAAIVDPAILASLRQSWHGDLIRPGDPAYDEARSLWNGMIDRHPAIIARAADTSDVLRGVMFARDNGLPLAVRGGGHNVAGLATREGGFVLDLSRMRRAEVDPARRRATIEAGALLSDLDAATQAHGLATPLGINSTTGVAGLTLGGGFGWLSRKHGLTIDNLESAEVVTAAGDLVRASATEHPDLFWAIRGGGGNFGVVTRFEFRLHPVGPDVLSGLIVYAAADARKVLQGYREFAAEAPDDLCVWAVLRLAPPLPFLPAEAHGRGMLALPFLYAGDSKEGEALVEPLRRLATPIGSHVGLQPYAAWQKTFDPLLAKGARNYWKSHNFTSLDDGLLDVVVDFAGDLPSPQCEIFIAALGGEVSRPSPDSAAYAHRDINFIMNVHARWDSPAEDETCITWARAFFQASAPFATGGVYVNFLTEDEGERVRAAYGPNHARLSEVKRRYDPNNLFQVNQNIRPA
jgi:FAD/FMN-containing dehydrogenase